MISVFWRRCYSPSASDFDALLSAFVRYHDLICIRSAKTSPRCRWRTQRTDLQTIIYGRHGYRYCIVFIVYFCCLKRIISMWYLRMAFLVGSSILFAGCSVSSSSQKQITYDNRFVVTIPQEFVGVPSRLVENKQLINKIVAAYKITNTQGFDNNLIISKSTLWPTLDVNQFRALQSKKLQRLLVGYQPEWQQAVSFSCNDEKVNGLYVTFTLNDTSNTPPATFYLAQYQYLYQGTGYILSYIAATESERNELKSSLTKITCISSATGSWNTTNTGDTP